MHLKRNGAMNNGHCNIADSSFTCTDCYFQYTRKQVVKTKRNECNLCSLKIAIEELKETIRWKS